MKADIVMGIDPGKGGGIAWCVDGEMFAEKMPDTHHDLKDLLKPLAPRTKFCFMEKVHSMPKQGVVSTFTFGTNYGMLQGMLTAYEIPFELLRPTVWQRGMGCLSKGDKNVTKTKAQQLFPKMKITHKTADALLICEYLRRQSFSS